MKFQESISEWSIETATSSLIRGSCSTQFVKIRDKIRKKKKLQTSKVQPWFLLIKEENYQVVGWYFKKIFPNDRWKRRHCFASLLRGSHFRRNYAGKSWINACLKPASFRRNAIRVIRRAPLSVSLSLSVCAMELRLSTQVTVSMVAQYGSMGNKFTRCLEHVVCLRVFPSCTSVWVMMIWLTRAAPFIANKPMENKTSNRVDGFEWSG